MGRKGFFTLLFFIFRSTPKFSTFVPPPPPKIQPEHREKEIKIIPNRSHRSRKRKQNGEGDIIPEEKEMSEQERKICLKILQNLMKHEWAWPFNKPVDPVALNVPDYFTVIKHPMDFGTIKVLLVQAEKFFNKEQKQLKEEVFSSRDEFIEDVRLVFSNATTYNRPGEDVYIMAESLLHYFEEILLRSDGDKKLKIENKIMTIEENKDIKI
jgi:hypothetical protein